MKSFERFLREKILVGEGEFEKVYGQKLRTGKPIVQILVDEGYIQPQELKDLLRQYLEEIEKEDEERIIAKILTRDPLLPEDDWWGWSYMWRLFI